MRPRNLARPAAAGALCFAFTCGGAQAALAQTETTTPSPEPTARAAYEPQIGVRHRKLNLRAGKRTVVAGKVSPAVAGLQVSLQVKREHRWRTIDRDRTGAAGRLQAARALPIPASAAARASASRARRACCPPSAGSAA